MERIRKGGEKRKGRKSEGRRTKEEDNVEKLINEVKKKIRFIKVTQNGVWERMEGIGIKEES